jgi:hypothetical protein
MHQLQSMLIFPPLGPNDSREAYAFPNKPRIQQRTESSMHKDGLAFCIHTPIQGHPFGQFAHKKHNFGETG